MPKAIKQGVKQTGENWRDNYITPPYLLEAMRDYAPDFYDPFLTDAPDALSIDWASYKGPPLWCNPPFSRYTEFYNAVRVAPVPQVWVCAHDHSTERFGQMLRDGWFICLLSKRVRFIDPRTLQPANNPSDCHTLIFTGLNTPLWPLKAFKPLGRIAALW